jgi:hypothetical protein
MLVEENCEQNLWWKNVDVENLHDEGGLCRFGAWSSDTWNVSDTECVIFTNLRKDNHAQTLHLWMFCDGFVMSDSVKLTVRVMQAGASRSLMQSGRLVVEFWFRIGKDLPVNFGCSVSCVSTIDGSEIKRSVDACVFVMDVCPLSVFNCHETLRNQSWGSCWFPSSGSVRKERFLECWFSCFCSQIECQIIAEMDWNWKGLVIGCWVITTADIGTGKDVCPLTFVDQSRCRRSILALHFSLLASQCLIDGGTWSRLAHPESQCHRRCLAFSFDKEAWVHGLGACLN